MRACLPSCSIATDIHVTTFNFVERKYFSDFFNKKSGVRFIVGLYGIEGRVGKALYSKHIRTVHCSEATCVQVGYLRTLSLSVLHSVHEMKANERELAAGIMIAGGNLTNRRKCSPVPLCLGRRLVLARSLNSIISATVITFPSLFYTYHRSTK